MEEKNEEVCPDCGRVHLSAELIMIDRFADKVELKGIYGDKWARLELEITEFDAICSDISTHSTEEGALLPYFAVMEVAFNLILDSEDSAENELDLANFPVIALNRDHKNDA